MLELVARGQSNPDIAQTLYISEKTVRNHVSNLFTKLQVADRARDRARPVGRARRGLNSRAGTEALEPARRLEVGSANDRLAVVCTPHFGRFRPRCSGLVAPGWS